MSISEEAYIKAENELNKRRRNAEIEYLEHCDRAHSIEPELAEITEKIAGANCEIIKAITKRSSDKKPSELIMQIKENNKLAHERKKAILQRLGLPENYLDHNYTCKLCSDTGFVNGKRCRCFDELLDKYYIEELSKDCDIAFHDFDEFKLDLYPDTGENGSPRQQMQMILNRCITYANEFSEDSPSLFFYGNTGLGKTFLSSCIAKKVILKGHSVVFRSILKVFDDALSEHFGKKTGNTLDKLRDSDLVILDDLGSEFSSQSDPILYQILNDRVNMHKPTIISSNMTLQQLNARYNERIVSRLLGEFNRFPFVGEDIRFKK